MKSLAAAVVLSLTLPTGAMAQQAGASPTTGAQTCKVEQARYRMIVPEEDGQWDLQFVPARHMAGPASDLYLRLTTPQRDYWFTLNMSLGYGGLSVMPVDVPVPGRDPDDLAVPAEDGSDEGLDAEVLATLRFLAFDGDFTVANNPPLASEPAPQAIMLPELGVTLWYSPGALTKDPAAERDPMPRGLFRLVGCGAAAEAVGE